MKKILYKNLFKDCIIFFLISLFSSAIIIWVFQAVNYLDLMVEDGRDFILYLNYTLLNFPKILTKLIPFVIFFSISYIISKYETNNELMIFWNIGINKIELVNFFLKLSLIILILQLFLTAFIVPTFQEISRNLIRGSEFTFGESLFKPKKFNDTIKNLTIYIDDKDQDGYLKNVYIKKNISENSFQVTFAKTGKFIQKGNNNILELYEGQTINKNDNKISNFTFSKSDFYFLENETGILVVNKIQEMSTLDMFVCLNNILNLNFKIFKNINEDSKHNCNSNGIGNIYKELYKRFILPFYVPILILITQLLIIKNKEFKNYSKYKLIIFLLGFLIIIFSESTLKIVENNFIDNLDIILFPLFLILFFYLYFFYLFKFRYTKSGIRI
jgi:lipopolysaccharide export system permease protein